MSNIRYFVLIIHTIPYMGVARPTPPQHPPRKKFHTQRQQSRPPVTSCRSSGAQTTLSMEPLCPSPRDSTCPECTSSTLRIMSSPAKARNRPDGETAQQCRGVFEGSCMAITGSLER